MTTIHASSVVSSLVASAALGFAGASLAQGGGSGAPSNNTRNSAPQRGSQATTRHTELLKSLIEAQGGQVSKEHCKGMEGLVAETLKHAVSEAPAKGPVLDAAIIAQYQRMTHYGITGFGTVAAFARA